jgi:hypothetical protein
MNKQYAKQNLQLTDTEIEDMIHEEQQAEFEQIDLAEDYNEPYAEYGEDYEDEPLFEKTNRQKGVRKVRD